MKIFIFCIMTMIDGPATTYQYKESFTSAFDCNKQAQIEMEKMSKQDTSDMKNVEFFCGTSENFVRKYL